MYKHNIIKMVGKTFGRWLVISRAPNDRSGNLRWNCVCKCGTKRTVLGTHLRNGTSPSCGCLSRERMTTHGGRKSRLYKIWQGMKERCYRQTHKHYHSYGGRGIVICDEWRGDFSAFMEWAKANGYRHNLMIDRIDNDAGYSAENCRFVDRTTQNNNKRTNVIVEYDGKQYTIAELARRSCVPYSVIVGRLYADWTTAKAAETAVAARTKRSLDSKSAVETPIRTTRAAI